MYVWYVSWQIARSNFFYHKRMQAGVKFRLDCLQDAPLRLQLTLAAKAIIHNVQAIVRLTVETVRVAGVIFRVIENVEGSNGKRRPQKFFDADFAIELRQIFHKYSTFSK